MQSLIEAVIFLHVAGIECIAPIARSESEYDLQPSQASGVSGRLSDSFDGSCPNHTVREEKMEHLHEHKLISHPAKSEWTLDYDFSFMNSYL